MLNRKGLFTLSALAISMVLITGCGGNDSNEEEEVQPPMENEEVQDENKEQTPDIETEPETEQDQTNNTEKGTSLKSEDDLEKEIASNDGIETVMVQVSEGASNRVNADITINDEQKKSAEEVADTYSKVIKKEYPDYVVDIIVVQDGKQLIQKTYE